MDQAGHFLSLDSRERGGGSLQKDLNVATQALGDVAIESAKEVLNPFAKLTKGIQNVVLKKGKDEPSAEEIIPPTEDISSNLPPNLPRSASSDYMAGKVADASSLTRVILL